MNVARLRKDETCNVRIATSADWDNLAAWYLDRPYPPFWRPEWREFLCRDGTTIEDQSLHFTFPTGVSALVPLLRVTGYLGRYAYASSTDDEYGGILSEQTLDTKTIRSVLNYLSTAFKPISMAFGPHFDVPLELPSSWTSAIESTHILALPCSHGLWLSGIANHTMRKNVRRAVKSRIQLTLGRSTREVNAFVDLYSKSAKRWKLSPTIRKPPEYFVDLATCPLTTFYIAWEGDHPAAGIITLSTERYAFYYRGASDLQFSSYRPADFVFSEMVRHCIESGIQIVNCGASAGHHGVVAFKEKAGAVRTEYRCIYSHDLATRTYTRYRANRIAVARRLKHLIRYVVPNRALGLRNEYSD